MSIYCSECHKFNCVAYSSDELKKFRKNKKEIKKEIENRYRTEKEPDLHLIISKKLQELGYKPSSYSLVSTQNKEKHVAEILLKTKIPAEVIRLNFSVNLDVVNKWTNKK